MKIFIVALFLFAGISTGQNNESYPQADKLFRQLQKGNCSFVSQFYTPDAERWMEIAGINDKYESEDNLSFLKKDIQNSCEKINGKVKGNELTSHRLIKAHLFYHDNTPKYYLIMQGKDKTFRLKFSVYVKGDEFFITNKIKALP